MCFNPIVLFEEDERVSVNNLLPICAEKCMTHNVPVYVAFDNCTDTIDD